MAPAHPLDTARFEPADLPLGFLVNAFGRVMAEASAEALQPLGIDPPLLGVLWFADLAPGCSQVEHARFHKRDATTFGRQVDELERRGLLRRTPVAGDRRARALEVTEPARALLAEGRARIRAAEAAATAGFDGDLAAVKRDLLRLLRAAAPPG